MSLRAPPSNGNPLPPGYDSAGILLYGVDSNAQELSARLRKAKGGWSLRSHVATLWMYSLLPTLCPLCYSLPNYSLAFSNIPGPRTPLSYAGAQLLQLFATTNTTAPVLATVLSYEDSFTVTWNVNAAVGRAQDFARLFAAELTLDY